MPTIIETPVIKNSTAFVTVNFKDEDGQAVAPKSATWTLRTLSGVVVNSREDVAIPAPIASTIVITLSGADLAISKGKQTQERILLIEGFYDSVEEDDVSIVDYLQFPVKNVPGGR
jgi:hypothetical protein